MKMINNNTSVESWTCYNRQSHARIDHILSILGLCELLLKQTIVGLRVSTDMNFADTGTRDDKQTDYLVGIKELEEKHGWKAKEVANEETMPKWLRVDWTKQGHEVSEESWYEMAIEYDIVRFLEREHPGLVEECTQVSAGAMLQASQDAKDFTPIEKPFLADGDLGPTGPSKIRQQVTSSVPLTRAQMHRDLDSLQRKHGVVHGTKQFNQKLGQPEGNGPEESINHYRQWQHQKKYELLKTVNPDYDPKVAANRPLKCTPSPFELSGEHRLEGNRKISLVEGFGGSGQWGQSGTDSGHVKPVATFESNPDCREFLKELNPDDDHRTNITHLREEKYARIAPIFTTRPVCVAHSNCHRQTKGNNDALMGQFFENSGGDAEHLQPAYGIVECTLTVMKSQEGKASPIKMLKKQLPSYHLTVLSVGASRTISPIDGNQAPLAHVRVHAFIWHKKCFPKPPVLQPNQAQPLLSFEHVLDEKGEAPFYSHSTE